MVSPNRTFLIIFVAQSVMCFEVVHRKTSCNIFSTEIGNDDNHLMTKKTVFVVLACWHTCKSVSLCVYIKIMLQRTLGLPLFFDGIDKTRREKSRCEMMNMYCVCIYTQEKLHFFFFPRGSRYTSLCTYTHTETE